MSIHRKTMILSLHQTFTKNYFTINYDSTFENENFLLLNKQTFI
jgi:hypothetical protein